MNCRALCRESVKTSFVAGKEQDIDTSTVIHYENTVDHQPTNTDHTMGIFCKRETISTQGSQVKVADADIAHIEVEEMYSFHIDADRGVPECLNRPYGWHSCAYNQFQS